MRSWSSACRQERTREWKSREERRHRGSVMAIALRPYGKRVKGVGSHGFHAALLASVVKVIVLFHGEVKHVFKQKRRRDDARNGLLGLSTTCQKTVGYSILDGQFTGRKGVFKTERLLGSRIKQIVASRHATVRSGRNLPLNSSRLQIPSNRRDHRR